MATFFAQPNDITASGFYFEDKEQFADIARKWRNPTGQIVEEFEIQFIDGHGIDAQLFEALNVNQANIGEFCDAIYEWSQTDKIKVIIAVGEVGYSFDLAKDEADQFDVDLYDCDTMRDLAMQFVDEGLFGDIPERLQNYLDWDVIARDLSMDYGEVTIDGKHYIYRCE